MAKAKKTAIIPTRDDDFNAWYQQLVKEADLAEGSSVRGCMIIKPWGYALWESIRDNLDKRFKALGVENAYFPLLVPLAALQKEAEHVDGFAKECAVVTHKKLEMVDGTLIPRGKLEEPYVIRPTSEMIIGESFSKWVNSYRDLPIKINQWANVMRWEMRPRIFLRTSEFLWQEGHTVHASKDEAHELTREVLKLYQEFVEQELAMSLYVGEKTESEKFPGADTTYTIEAIMQDGKALQAGTSHFLGQNFSKAQNIKYLSQEGFEQLAWTTSWGVSTRLIGGMIMNHGDDNGMVLPPRVARYQVCFIPVYKNDDEKVLVMEKIEQIKNQVEQLKYNDSDIRILVDDSDDRWGNKYWKAVKRGIPLIVELGQRDIEKNQVVRTRRDIGVGNKEFIPMDNFIENISSDLEAIQNNLLELSKEHREKQCVNIESKEGFKQFLKHKETPMKHALLFLQDCEEVRGLLAKNQMSFRCLPLGDSEKKGQCLVTGHEVLGKVLVGQAY